MRLKKLKTRQNFSNNNIRVRKAKNLIKESQRKGHDTKMASSQTNGIKKRTSINASKSPVSNYGKKIWKKCIKRHICAHQILRHSNFLKQCSKEFVSIHEQSAFISALKNWEQNMLVTTAQKTSTKRLNHNKQQTSTQASINKLQPNVEKNPLDNILLLSEMLLATQRGSNYIIQLMPPTEHYTNQNK